MGAASCKNSKSSEQNQENANKKNITIGVFGLDYAGKTSTVKAIEGSPIKHAISTVSTNTSIVPYPVLTKRDEKSHEPIQIIDVSGRRQFREHSWPDYYDKIHGLIFVLDASEKKRIIENKQTLEDLLGNDKLRDKPILILANKQDLDGAIEDEKEIKRKLDIDQLKIKYKIEFCTAIKNNNKDDDSIRKGFSWLIRTIEANYSALNARVVNNAKGSNRSKPIGSKNDRKSDDSNSEDEPPTPPKRMIIPPYSKARTDFRPTNDSNKLPSINHAKNIPKPSSRDTHSEDDNDDDVNYNARVRARPVISPVDNDDYSYNRSSNQANTTKSNTLTKKKKVIGPASNANKDTSYKKSNDNEPKSYRVPYESLPEDDSWSSMKKTSKTNDTLPNLYSKSSITNDATKKYPSPLLRDIKPNSSSLTSKGSNYSDNDDDDSFSKRDKSKSTFPPKTRYDDDDDSYKKFSSSYSKNKPPFTPKKTTLGVYGADDDDDDKLNNKTNHRPFGSTPTKKLFKHDEEDEEGSDPFKKTSLKLTKTVDSDDDDKKKTSKSYLSSSDRLNFDNDYRRTTSKPPISPAITTKRSKDDDDDDDSPLPKPLSRSRFPNDNYLSTLSKPTNRLIADDDDDSYKKSPSPYSASKSLSTPKKPTSSTYGADNDDDDGKYNTKNTHRPFATTSTTKKLGRFDEEDEEGRDSLYKTSLKITKFFDSDDDDKKKITKSYLSSSDRSNLDNDYRRTTTKPPLSPATTTKRSKDNDDDSPPSKSLNRSLSTYKSATTTKKGDDDDDDDDDDDYKSKSNSKPKVPLRFNDDDDLPSSSSKFGTRSKYDDDDDDNPSSFSKPTIRSKYGSDNRSSSPLRSTSISRKPDDKASLSSSKVNTRSNFEDDDDDRPPISSKSFNRSKHDDDNKSSSPLNPKSHSKFDDDDYPSLSSKLATQSPRLTARSKFTDDDYTSPSKKNSFPSRDDDYSGKGGLRSRIGNDDFDSNKGGFNSARVGSAATQRFRPNMNDDD
ncbi:unnamed protein product [Rotaria magnacalcarata]|uniref:Uncharacterized protein n=2 Tax=Rotaria magnacalcarata TaxID=392030 RepID=A0A819U2M6_9BILA|nr:unnamed protein product [Rotaria magnacalcarata]